jgi:hypothetical protein
MKMIIAFIYNIEAVILIFKYESHNLSRLLSGEFHGNVGTLNYTLPSSQFCK